MVSPMVSHSFFFSFFRPFFHCLSVRSFGFLDCKGNRDLKFVQVRILTVIKKISTLQVVFLPTVFDKTCSDFCSHLLKQYKKTKHTA